MRRMSVPVIKALVWRKIRSYSFDNPCLALRQAKVRSIIQRSAGIKRLVFPTSTGVGCPTYLLSLGLNKTAHADPRQTCRRIRFFGAVCHYSGLALHKPDSQCVALLTLVGRPFLAIAAHLISFLKVGDRHFFFCQPLTCPPTHPSAFLCPQSYPTLPYPISVLRASPPTPAAGCARQ